jgi:hypothetical protein
VVVKGLGFVLCRPAQDLRRDTIEYFDIPAAIDELALGVLAVSASDKMGFGD